jgi:hypothetical protein
VHEPGRSSKKRRLPGGLFLFRPDRLERRYSYFDKTSASGPTVTLTLTVLSFDADWNLVSSPPPGLFIDGKATASKPPPAAPSF